jgi:hypothetical protein
MPHKTEETKQIEAIARITGHLVERHRENPRIILVHTERRFVISLPFFASEQEAASWARDALHFISPSIAPEPKRSPYLLTLEEMKQEIRRRDYTQQPGELSRPKPKESKTKP